MSDITKRRGFAVATRRDLLATVKELQDPERGGPLLSPSEVLKLLDLPESTGPGTIFGINREPKPTFAGVDRTAQVAPSLVDIWEREMSEMERRFERDVLTPAFENYATITIAKAESEVDAPMFDDSRVPAHLVNCAPEDIHKWCRTNGGHQPDHMSANDACPRCGLAGQLIRMFTYRDNDTRESKLADECGRLKTENTELLAENARLRRALERKR